MIIQKEFLNKLRDFGLNSYEAKLWTALLSRGVSTAGELSDIANVPRSRSYDVLESLEKKGFIIMKIGKPIKYIAVPPEEVLERVKKKVLDDAEKHSSLIDKLKTSEVLSELNLLHTQGLELVEPTSLSGAIKGRNNIYNHLETMIKGAEKTVTLMTTEEGIKRKMEALKFTLKKAKSKGVKIRVVVPKIEQDSAEFKELSKIAEVKTAKNMTARLCIVDAKEMTFMVINDQDIHPTYDLGIWINTPFFVGVVETMFNNIWQSLK